MKNEVFTIREFCLEIKRSGTWVRRAITMDKIKAKKVGNQYLIPETEVRRFKKWPFQIKAREM